MSFKVCNSLLNQPSFCVSSSNVFHYRRTFIRSSGIFSTGLVQSDAAPSSGSRRSRCTRVIAVGFGNLPFLALLLFDEDNSGLSSVIAEASDVELGAASRADCGSWWSAEYFERGESMSVNVYYNILCR